MYLVTVMNGCRRTVLSREVPSTMNESICINALEWALRLHPTPEISNPDQGSQFTGQAVTGAPKEAEIKISMAGKGRALDNIIVQRLWHSMKYEAIYLKEYADVEALRKTLPAYVHFYNNKRPHRTFNGQVPVESSNKK